jgi:uncharacterized protein (TIGR03083 family)
MSIPTINLLEAISEHSFGFAAAAEGNFDAKVEHCPGWTVFDLVEHLTEVQWFWATIVDERLTSPPDESRRPGLVKREELITTFELGVDRLIRALHGAHPDDHVYTWAPSQQNVAFITRHQVQEAAVHHWDAAHAAGVDLDIETSVAVDAVDEFLTFSVSTGNDPADPPRQPLGGTFALRCTDADHSWVLFDGSTPGTVAFEANAPADVPAITATSSDLLLWLYGRVSLGSSDVAPAMLERFRGLCYTD